MRIDCLLGTYGRHSFVREALACFLQQSRISQATLLIYNQHPKPMWCDHPRVRVVNEPLPPQALRYIKLRMIELADANADFIHFWDDDDLCLPWHLDDCITHIGTHVAWKPASCWLSEGNVKFSRHANMFEGSWIFRLDYIRESNIDTLPDYTDHPVYLQTLEKKRLEETELGGRTSYIYRWANGAEHLSAHGGFCTPAKQIANIEMWRARSNDVSASVNLIPADLTPRWQQYLSGIEGLVTPAEWELNRKLTRSPPFESDERRNSCSARPNVA
jgi:hypothetical protein